MIRSARRARLMAGTLAAAAVAAGAPVAVPAPALAAPSAAAPVAACQHWTSVATPATGSVDVRAVATLSAGNVWAVGDIFHAAAEQGLIEHWNGSSWTVMDGPELGSSTSSELDGVFALSANNIWAVGWESRTTTGQQTLVEHWNGTTWTQQPSPSPGEFSELTSVHAVSARDAWAVGQSESDSSNLLNKTLILHWDGAKWTRRASPSPDQNDGLTGVTATSARDAWAVGGGGSRIEAHALILHWNGAKWIRAKSPKAGLASQLTGVSAMSATSAWAVGAFSNGNAVQTLILRWNGKSWQRSASPDVGNTTTFNFLNAVVMTSARNGWAVGGHDPVPPTAGVENPLLLRWNGTAWKVVTGPSPAANAVLAGVAANSAGSAWAVGSDNGTGVGQTFAWQCH
jgi:hypothetical protein